MADGGSFNPDDLLTKPMPESASMVIRPRLPQAALSPSMRALLDTMIAPGESSGNYNVIYGGKTVDDLSSHPDIATPITEGPNAGKSSTAAGKYQFIKPTWDEAARALGLTDFSPGSQDRAAAWLAKKTYQQATGRDIESDYASGDPSLREGIRRALSSQWEALGKPGPRQDKLWTLGNDRFRFSDEAMGADDLHYMHPDDYLALSPSMQEDGGYSGAGWQALRTSLANGENINHVPGLTTENGKVTAQDGRSRALLAKLSGLEMLPVAVKGGITTPEIEGMSGAKVPAGNLVPSKQMERSQSGGSIVGRMLGIGSAQAAEADPWSVVKSEPAAAGQAAGPSAGEWDVVKSEPHGDGAQTPMTKLDRLGTGVMDPLFGAGQLVAHAIPDPSAGLPPSLASKLGFVPGQTLRGEADKTVRERELNIAATTPKDASKFLGGDPFRFAGEVLSPPNFLAPARALGTGGLLSRMGSAGVQGAAIGAMEPVTKGGNYKHEKATQVALGGALSAPIPAAEKLIRTLGSWLRGAVGDAEIRDRAVQGILDRILKDQKAGGTTFQDMIDLVNATPGKPMTIADVGDANLKSLLGRVARSPGDAKSIMAEFMNNRDLTAGTRVTTDVMDAAGSSSRVYADEALKAARSIQAKPLFDKAYEGGSLAPLREQFESANAAAARAESDAAREVAHAETRITEAARREQQAGDNVYGVNGAREDRRAAEAQRTFAQQQLAQAQAEKQMIAERLAQAQEDIATNKPGAVWSPRIQEYLDNPRVKRGIQRGLVIERDAALNERRPMNPSEYAITGVDEAGNSIVGKVPNMRLLAVAKEGLDAMVFGDEFRNKFGQLDKEGVEIDKMRRGLVAELDRLNPDYRAAREQWGGDTQSMVALKAGQGIFKMDPEAIESLLHGSSPEGIAAALEGKVPQEVIDQAVDRATKGMSASDREFFRLGAANEMRKIIESTGERGDETRRLIATTRGKRQLRAMFDSQEEFDKFFKALNAEHLMFDTWSKTYGGSQTAERVAEDSTATGIGHALHGAYSAARGNIVGAGHSLARAASRLLPKQDPRIAAEQARILTDPAAEAIAKMQAAGAARKPSGDGIAPYIVEPWALGTNPFPPASGSRDNRP